MSFYGNIFCSKFANYSFNTIQIFEELQAKNSNVVCELLHKRDEIVADWQAQYPDVDALADKRLEITLLVRLTEENTYAVSGSIIKRLSCK